MGDNIKLGHRNTGPEERDLGNDIRSHLMVGFRFRSVECHSIITPNGIIIQSSADACISTYISSCSDGFHIQLVFKFCIVIGLYWVDVHIL